MEAPNAADLVTRFHIIAVLNQGPPYVSFTSTALADNTYLDQGGRRVTLQGTIDGSPALLTAERAAFPSDIAILEVFHAAITEIDILGENDIYRWYLASSGITREAPADLKINLIFPCTDKHIKKYSPQTVRMVTETPAIYRQHVKPYMQRMRDEGRLNWVFNIIEGRKEQEDILLREPGPGSSQGGFLLTPDLNWDKKTLTNLHLLVLVDRRDIWSLRDLKKSHVSWMKHVREKILEATVKLYPELEKDMLKLYVHCIFIQVGIVSYLTQLKSYRSAHVLPFPHPCCPRYVRSHKHTISRQGFRPRKCHLAIGSHGWRARS